MSDDLFEELTDGAIADELKIGSAITTSPATGKGLFSKMSRVMSEMSRIPKRGKVAFGTTNYDYVKSEDVSDIIRQAFVNVGLAFFVDIEKLEREVVQRTGKADRTRTVVHFLFTFADIETGETRSSRWIGEAMDDDDKGVAKAATLATKYFLLRTFVVSTGDEIDPDAMSGDGKSGSRSGRSGAGASQKSAASSSGNGSAETGVAGKEAGVVADGVPKSPGDWETFYNVVCPAFRLTREEGAAVVKEVGKNAIAAYNLIVERAKSESAASTAVE